MESAGLTLLQRLHESPEIISQICVRVYAGENIHSFLHSVDLVVAVSWKGNSPNPLSQTPQEVSSPILIPLKLGGP